ncbi:MAG: hypothetical protein KDE27_13270 [Planctomycetes bacterium]|nr:hypothetical protein [Planctomycetota bacterium]
MSRSTPFAARACQRRRWDAVALGLGLAGSAAAQTDWRREALFVPREALAGCFDPVRQVALWFGGDDGAAVGGELWEWDGSAFTLRELPGGPPARAGSALAWDQARQRAVLFGGSDGQTELGDSWTFDGMSWSQLAGGGPPARRGHAMAWDGASANVVLFGGSRNQVLFGDTWTFDGSSWSNAPTSSGPSPRVDAAMATPAGVAARPLLFGGRTASGLSNGLFRWNGGAWVAVGSNGPAARERAAFAADGTATGVLLCAGRDALGSRSDTWRYDGSQWTAMPLAIGLSARSGAAAVFDAGSQRVLVAGGIDGAFRRRGDLLALRPAAPPWTTLHAADTPPARHAHGTAYDPVRGRTVLFGGGTSAGQELGDTWEWDGAAWRDRSAFGPSPRQFHALAFDDMRQRCLLFGGSSAGSTLGDTWEWDGAGWNPLLPATTPTARRFHALVRAPNGGVLLFGGIDALQQVLGDSWRWTGSDWQPVAAPGPPPRLYHAMAFDARRRQVVLFGGSDGSAFHADTWTFDGSQWQQHTAVAHPGARAYAAMTYAAERDRVVLHGGLDPAFQALGDTWEWHGGTRSWNAIATANAPAPRFLARLVHHDTMSASLLIGGGDGAVDRPETMRYVAAATATVVPFGFSCPLAGGGPELLPRAYSRPWLGDSFEIDLVGLPPQPGLAFVVYGFTDTQWGPIPLPATLGAYGLPGCQLFCSADEPFPVFHSGQPIAFPFPIPLQPSFAGFEFFNQAIVFDPSYGNPANAAVTGALRNTVGLR